MNKAISAANIRALRRAVMIVGSQRKLAEKLSVSQPTVSIWLKDGSLGCPEKHAVNISKICFNKVSPAQLRKDKFKLSKLGNILRINRPKKVAKI